MSKFFKVKKVCKICGGEFETFNSRASVCNKCVGKMRLKKLGSEELKKERLKVVKKGYVWDRVRKGPLRCFASNCKKYALRENAVRVGSRVVFYCDECFKKVKYSFSVGFNSEVNNNGGDSSE